MSTSTIRFLVSRHSAFYSPVISTLSAGFLAAEGLEGTYAVLPAGRTARDMIRQGEIDVVQAAVSTSWGPMEKGETDLPVHFAQINQRDGFFLVARRQDAWFHWKKLGRSTLVADHGGQPFVMLRYAAHVQGADWDRIQLIDAGAPDEMEAAFRAGQGDYVHLQGPAAQQLEADGIGSVVASIGASMPVVAFSSLMASRAFLATEQARAVVRAYRKARGWAQQAAVGEIAASQAGYFPGISPAALAAAIRNYQKLGCWLGDLAIPRDQYEQALDVFLYSGAIGRRHPYDEVVCECPS